MFIATGAKWKYVYHHHNERAELPLKATNRFVSFCSFFAYSYVPFAESGARKITFNGILNEFFFIVIES